MVFILAGLGQICVKRGSTNFLFLFSFRGIFAPPDVIVSCFVLCLCLSDVAASEDGDHVIWTESHGVTESPFFW